MGLINSENATVHAPNKDYNTVSIYVYIRASLVADSTKTPRNGSAPSYSFQRFIKVLGELLLRRGRSEHDSEQPVHLSRPHRTRLVQIARCAMPSLLCHFSVTTYYVKMVYTGFIPSQFSSLPFWFSQTTLE